MQITDLVERDLAGFKIKELTEVFKTNKDGSVLKSIGFFRDKDIARNFMVHQTNPLQCGTRKVFVLTNNEQGFASSLFLVGHRVTLLNDEKAALEILRKVMAKLNSEEKAILGL